MPEFEVNISDGKGKTTSVQAKGPAANTLIGMKIGDEVAGDVFGLPKQVLKITGGSDKSGFPMIPWLPGGAKRQIYVRKKDTREKRWVRGNTITEEVVQVNMVVVGENKPTDGSGARRGSSALLRRDDRVNNGDGRIRGLDRLSKSLVEAPVLNVGVVGHVDHGKTTLVQALTGVWTGKHSEEMKRGMTIKLGYASMRIMKCPRCPPPLCYSTSDVCPHCGSKTELVRKISIIDAPGHEVLMATMLSGAAVMNAALLVVAANEDCPQPQTVEHFAALTIMGIRQLIVVQTKVDVVSEDQAMKNYSQIRAFLKGTWAENAPVIPVSAVDNLNIDVLLQAMYEYFKPPLVDVNAAPKFYVTRSFDINKPGTRVEDLRGATVGGSLIRGKLRVGDELVISPGVKDSRGNYRPLETVAVSMAMDTEVKEAVPGGLLAISTDLDPSYSKADRLVGQVVFKKGSEEKPVLRAVMSIKLFETVLGTNEPLKVTPIAPTEDVLVEAGPALVLANFRPASKGSYEVTFRRPVILEKGQTAAISRRFKNRWRLSGYGTVERLLG